MLPPDRHASGVSTRTTTSGGRVARTVGSFGNLPLNRDVSLLTALVGAMIVNESQAALLSAKPAPPLELPPKDSLQEAIGDALYDSILQLRPEGWLLALVCDIQELCRHEEMATGELEKLILTFLPELSTPNSQSPLGYQLAVDRLTQVNLSLAGEDSDDQTGETGTNRPFVSDELDRSGSEAFYAVDEHVEASVAEFLEQLFAQEAFVPDAFDSDIYEVTLADLSDNLSMEWSGQDPAIEATADTQQEQEEDSRTSLTEADFEDLNLEEG